MDTYWNNLKILNSFLRQLFSLNRLTIYFNINLYKFNINHPLLGRPTQLPHYFKNNFTLIISVWKENTDLFEIRRQVMVLLMTAVFIFFSWCCENFLLQEFVNCCEKFFISKIFLLQAFLYGQGLFFLVMRNFLLLREVFYCYENFVLVGRTFSLL